jgi:hypothetical protein
MNVVTPALAAATESETLGGFALELRLEDIPQDVSEVMGLCISAR